MDLCLKNKTVYITGGSRGIGLSIVEAFLCEGSNVAFISRSKDVIEELINKLSKKFNPNQILGICSDASLENEVFGSMDLAKKKFGQIDILISNVGDGRSVPEPISEKDQFQKVWDQNFTTAENLARVGLKFLNPNSGQIVFISSIAGLEAFGAPTDYSVAKSAIISLSKNLARKLAPNIRVNCIAPGNIFFEGSSWDEKIKENPEKVNNIIQNTVPMKRFGTPQEISNVVLFLCSEKASFVTGSCIVVDGGQTVSI